MGHLITATILSSYKWMQTAPVSWKDRATTDFMAKLKREDKFEPTPEITRGINFERLICDRCNTMELEPFIRNVRLQMEEDLINVSDEYLQHLDKLAKFFYNKCRGGEQQVKLTRDIEVEGEVFTLFGYADIVFPNKLILDIKTCTKYKEEKYTNSIQHSIYQYCSGIKNFQYIIADFKGSVLPQQFHIVDATCTDLQIVENVLIARIKEMVHWLKANNLYSTYLTRFCKGH